MHCLGRDGEICLYVVLWLIVHVSQLDGLRGELSLVVLSSHGDTPSRPSGTPAVSPSVLTTPLQFARFLLSCYRYKRVSTL